jgi:hypothetical protein
MDGMGTDEEVISRILGGADKATAAEILVAYQAKYDVNLVDRIKSEIGGHYEAAVVTWLTAPDPTGFAFRKSALSSAVDIQTAVENTKVRQFKLCLFCRFHIYLGGYR